MSGNDDEIIRERPGWLIPLGVIVAVTVLSAALMMYYLAPGGSTLFQEQVVPTSSGEPIALAVRGASFRIPANYLEYESTRQGGERREIALFALLPALSGWSNWQANAFTDNSPDSRVIFLTVREDRNDLPESERLQRVYMGYVTTEAGKPGPYGLMQYDFRANSGYRDEDLYVGTASHGLMVLRCVRPSAEVPSPSCLRDTMLTKGVSLSYRFKRTHLADWRRIADGVDALIASFRK